MFADLSLILFLFRIGLRLLIGDDNPIAALLGGHVNVSKNALMFALPNTAEVRASINKRMIKGLDYWYDAQQRRFLEQIVRAFSGFQYQTGWREVDGVRIEPQLKMVPCTLAKRDRMVAAINRNLSENTLLSVPMITVWQTGIRPRREHLQHPGHVDTRQVFERDIDPNTGEYLDSRGRTYTVQRMMPRPFEMLVDVSIWTSNLDQKHQLFEQIATVFFPDIAIQNSDNALDWTALTMMFFDDVNWSSQSMPIGTENEIDILTINLKLPFWLSPPAKVMQQKVIEQIVTNIYEGRSTDTISEETFMTRDITTPGNHQVRVENGKITLLGPEGAEHTPDGQIYSWDDLLKLYGALRPTISQLRLKTNPDLDDSTHDLIGTIQFDAAKPNELFWQIDPATLPGNTLPPINAIIDPLRTFPGNGLPVSASGQRYLVVHDLAGPSQAWGTLSARANDIVQFNGTSWSVVYSPVVGNQTPEYVLNLNSGRQLRWNGWDWVLTVDGTYPAGMWRLAL